MNEISDSRLAWQPDIYQRYSFLAKLTDVFAGEGTGALSLLDIGSGPIQLTREFVSTRFEIVRADVGEFDDPSIVRLQPGEPLPFEDASFDVAVAIEVLEHVPPAQRPGLIRELQRVSRQATILCCPVGAPEVVDAETRFSSLARAISGRDVDFLVEHRDNGLPDAAQVANWFSGPWSTLVAENAPLDEWLAFNVIDFILACDLGDHDVKRRFAATVNSLTPHTRLGSAHYRRFFCSIPSPAHAANAARVIETAKSSVPADSLRLVHELFTGVLSWREEMREHALPELVASREHIVKLDAVLQEFKEALAAKDAHISKLDDVLAGALEGHADAERALGAAHADLATRHEEIARLESERVRLQAAIASADSVHAHASDAERQLEAILASRSWRMTAPLRQAKTALRSRTVPGPRRIAAAIRRRARAGLVRSGGDYRLIATSGLFDTAWYLHRYPDVVDAQVDPLVHYLKWGARERRDPHPLFNAIFYLESNPDVSRAGVNPLAHYLRTGGLEGRDPSPYFDSSFYLDNNPDVASAGVNPLRHYLLAGAAEGRAPHPNFDGRSYLAANPDVAAAGMNPLVHYATSGRAEGRSGMSPGMLAAPASSVGYVPPQGRLPWFNPLNVVVLPHLANEPRLNVLVPGLGMRHMSGGPNTALEIAGGLALAGVRVRLISTEAPFDRDLAPFRAHMRGLLGVDLPADVELVSASERGVPLSIGERDLFMATAWWTAQQAKYAIRHTRHSRFVYLIQDYEPLFHPASTQQALAEETYSLDHLPVVNSQWLHEFLVSERIGRFADPAFAERSLIFQPAVNRALFFPELNRSHRKRRRLLFYARPTGGLRNLFELGVAALEKAVADGTLDPERWEILGMGEPFDAVSLGRGLSLTPAPWLNLESYAKQMRESDILLSLMLSPHPSYPPLEMAACGGLAVTTAFANKTPEALADLSANLIGIAPTLEGISQGLEAAISRLDDVDGRRAAAAINLPDSWRSSLAGLVPRLFDELVMLQGSPVRKEQRRPGDAGPTSIVAPGFRNWPHDEYEVHRLQAFERRASQYPPRADRGLISLLTPVWNVPAEYFDALADSILGQDANPASFEWVVLDNGSDKPETLASLERVRRHPSVRFVRTERNVGIIQGTRLCLENAANRYTATVDHDDLLTPDCIRVLSHALAKAGYPALAYTDEDKIDGGRFGWCYLKPSFDPVLFANSCYIAHLSLVDRELALRLGAYTDTQAEGSHDWDTFVRFVLAGHIPLHIPEVLYSWRMHQESTAGNIHSKPFVYDSQVRVLSKLLAGLSKNDRFRVEASPLFGGMPDWWMRRNPSAARPITTVVLGPPGRTPDLNLSKDIQHDVVRLDPAEGVPGLARIASHAAEGGRLLHILWHDTRIVDDVWALEAIALFELFPDTAMVGGRLHQNGRIVDAGAYFGFGRTCDSPDRDRPLTDPGYFAQAWKWHSVSTVTFDHCVIDPHFAADTLGAQVPPDLPLEQLGAWLGAAARRRNRRVVYTPFLSAVPGVDRGSQIPSTARRAFVVANSDLIPDVLLWPPRAGLRRGQPYRFAAPFTAAPSAYPDALMQEAELSYEQELEADRIARSLPESQLASDVAFSLMTGVYLRSPAEPLRAAIQSVLSQTHERFEWIVYRDGPVSPELQEILDDLAREPRVRVIDGETCRGIQHGFRVCLEAATCEWVVPIDADDLLEADALAVLASTIAKRSADFVFSDEDHLVDGKMRSRYARPGFDPVLNIESSYIWHLSAFRRDRARAVGAYTDSGAELCHDWDTSTRFAQSGAVMVHVPHVLYHWRSHAASSSNVPTQNPGTVASTRAVLEHVVASQPSPSHYEIAEYPIYRGAVEWWIRRRPIGDPSFGVMVLGADERSSDAVAACHNLARARSIVAMPGHLATLDDWRCFGDALPTGVDFVAVLGESWLPAGEDWFWEAIKWFELQPDTAIVSGRLVDDAGIVIDAGLARRRHRVVPVYRGMRRQDPGPFALALKAQTIYAPAGKFFVADRAFLQSAVESVLRDGFAAPFGTTLGSLALAAGRRVVFSPLLEARHQRLVRPVRSNSTANDATSVSAEPMALRPA